MGNQSSYLAIDTAASDRFSIDLIANRDVAEQHLATAEQQDMYVEECNDDPVNRRARQQMVYAPNHIAYREWFSAIEQLRTATSWLPPRIQNELDRIVIISLMPSADGGMPHTRPGGLICVPRLERLTRTTLLHELWHVHQREHLVWWARVFREWGWEEAHLDLPPSLESHRRYNPDTLDSPIWVYRKTWIPVPVLPGPSSSLHDAELWFYHSREFYHRRTVPEELKHAFPGAPVMAFEHPRELAAYLLSEPNTYKGASGFQHLLELVGQTSLPQ